MLLSILVAIASIIAFYAYTTFRRRMKEKDLPKGSSSDQDHYNTELSESSIVKETDKVSEKTSVAMEEPVVETAVAAETANDATDESNKKPKTPRKTTRARKK